MQKIIHNAETIICPVRIFASRNSHLGTLCSLQPLKFEIYWFKNKILKFSLGHTFEYAVLFFQEQMILFSDRLHSLQQMLSRTFKLHNPDSLTWPIAHCGQLLCANIYGLARSAWFTLGQTHTMDIANILTCTQCTLCTVCLVHTWAGFEICNQRSPILCAWTLWTILWLDCADVFLIVHTWLVRYYFHISSTHFHFFIIRYSFILLLLIPLAQWQC